MISKIELAVRTPSQEMAAEFDRIFDTDEYFQEIWHLVNKETLPEWFRPYPDLEAEASSIRTFGLALIPGLLQTAEYAREIFRTGQSPEQLEQLLATRMKRKAILERGTPPRLWVVLDEKALRCAVGGPDVMKAQIGHLIELAHRRTITIQIVPNGRGAYIGLLGSITILGFDEGPDVAYSEGQIGGQLVEEITMVETSAIRFELIRASAMSQEDSLDLLKMILESL